MSLTLLTYQRDDRSLISIADLSEALRQCRGMIDWGAEALGKERIMGPRLITCCFLDRPSNRRELPR